MPAHNVEAYLAPCLDSLVSQIYPELQIIVVNDGATDATGSIARDYQARDDRIVVIDQPNRGPGPGGGRNGGLAAATGDFLMFVDADDVLAPNCVSRLVRALDTADVANEMATIGVNYLANDTAWPSAIHEHSHDRNNAGTTLASTPALAADTTPWNKLFRREFFDRVVGEWPEQVLYEDTHAMIRCHLASAGTAVCATTGYHWRQRPDGTSITQQASLSALTAQVTATTLALQELHEHDREAFQQLSWRVVSIDLAWMMRQLGIRRGREREQLLALIRDALSVVDDEALTVVNRRLGRGYKLVQDRQHLALATWFVTTRLVLFPDGRSFADARSSTDPLWTLNESRNTGPDGLELVVSRQMSGEGTLELRAAGANGEVRTIAASGPRTFWVGPQDLRVAQQDDQVTHWFVDVIDGERPDRRGPLRRSTADLVRSRVLREDGAANPALLWCDGRLVLHAT